MGRGGFVMRKSTATGTFGVAPESLSGFADVVLGTGLIGDRNRYRRNVDF